MRASKPSFSAVAMAAILSLVSTRVASSHVVQPHSADGIIDGCHAPLARQELQFISTSRSDDHLSSAALVRLIYVLHSQIVHG